MIKRFRLVNNFCCKFQLLVSVKFIFFLSLVWVAIFGFLAGSPFVLFAFTDSDSLYLCSLIVNHFNVSASASNLSCFSLVNISFHYFFVYGRLTESIHSYVVGIQSYVMGICFLFCNDAMYFISNLLIGKRCKVAIIAIYYGPEKFRIVFIPWGFNARLFIHCIKLVH